MVGGGGVGGVDAEMGLSEGGENEVFLCRLGGCWGTSVLLIRFGFVLTMYIQNGNIGSTSREVLTN